MTPDTGGKPPSHPAFHLVHLYLTCPTNTTDDAKPSEAQQYVHRTSRVDFQPTQPLFPLRAAHDKADAIAARCRTISSEYFHEPVHRSDEGIRDIENLPRGNTDPISEPPQPTAQPQEISAPIESETTPTLSIPEYPQDTRGDAEIIGTRRVRRCRCSARVPGTLPKAWAIANIRSKEEDTRQYLERLRVLQDIYRRQFDENDPRSRRGLNAQPGEPDGLRIVCTPIEFKIRATMAARNLNDMGGPMPYFNWRGPHLDQCLDYWVYGKDYLVRVHPIPRRGLFDPSILEDGFRAEDLTSTRYTVGTFAMQPRIDSWRSKGTARGSGRTWMQTLCP